MKKLKLTQAEIDKLVTVERIDALPTVYGLGCNDVPFNTAVSGVHIWQYLMWKSMTQRCFDEKLKARKPTYKDVTCCDEWLSFANFFEWVNKEVGYSGKLDGYQFDKDLIVKGNRVYSPEACSFVPREVNVLLTDHKAARGEWPVGVCFHNRRGKWVAMLSCDASPKHLGYYSTPEEAFSTYKIAKEAQIKVVALRHKDFLKPAVFESLMIWEIQP